MSRFRWETAAGAAGRYRDTATGRFVSGAAVRGELDGYLNNTDSAAKALAEGLRGRQLSLADWELGMRQHIKNVHLNAIALERGGWANMRPQDYGRAGQVIREQYGYLRNFADQSEAGTQRLDGTLGRRARMYSEAARTTFYNSKHANRRPEISHVRSMRNGRDSCEECTDLDGRWYRIDDAAYKLPGQRICLTSCLCAEELGAAQGEGVEMVEAV